MKKVLITDYAHEKLEDGFVKRGYEVDYLPDISPEEVLERIENYEGLIVNSKIQVDEHMMKKGVLLKFVGRLGSGLEIIDQKAAKEHGIYVINSPEGNRNAVAEHALGMLLAYSNKLVSADREVRTFSWDREAMRGFELKGKTIGIIGYGHTGSMFAKRLKGLGMNILVYDKYKKVKPLHKKMEIMPDMVSVQAHADIISFHLPLTKETKGMVGEAWMSRCKKGVILINTSRGKILQTAALLSGLKHGQIGGVCLDVFENEKPASMSANERSQYEQLFSYDQNIFSPHVAGWTFESKIKIANTLLRKIDKLTI